MRPRTEQAGFALPMVLVLVLVSGILLVVMMDRQANHTLSVRRELETYQFHHVSRGIQEAVEAWIRSNGTNDIAPALDDHGLAFDLQVEGGEVVHIFFFESQGNMLADFGGLGGDTLETAREALAKLRESVGDARAMQLVRKEGPVAVSVNTARDEVLRAMISTVLDRVATNGLVDAIEKARQDALIDNQLLGQLYDAADVPAEVRAHLQGLITAQPVVWQVIAEQEPPAGVYPRPAPIRYGGTALVAGAAARDKTASLQRNSSIVSWENLTER